MMVVLAGGKKIGIYHLICFQVRWNEVVKYRVGAVQSSNLLTVADWRLYMRGRGNKHICLSRGPLTDNT